MWFSALSIAIGIGTFSLTDRLLTRLGFQGVYYAIHAIHNAAVVYTTFPDVQHTFEHFGSITQYSNNQIAINLVYALHLYHCILYWRKFRFDDWLHHILMIGLALPIGTYYESHTLVGFSLFFTTGLPGCIDYALLFGVRNGWVSRMTEKGVNRALNIWVRSPGCVSAAVFNIAFVCDKLPPSSPMFWLVLAPAVLNYWNGQYFMGQVVADYAQLGNRATTMAMYRV
jgi:hypothetical protein